MIVELEEAKRELVGMRPDIEDLGSALRVDALAAKVEELEQTTLAPDFWNNQANSSKVLIVPEIGGERGTIRTLEEFA